MTARFTVLASGSSGNATLLEVDGFGLMIDCGLPPRFLSARLAAVGASWDRVQAVVLTHTHGDHWKDSTLANLRSRKIPIYGHPSQLDFLNGTAPSFPALHAANLTRTYGPGRRIDLAPRLSCLPIEVSHDSDPTFAFRFDYRDGNDDGPAWSIGHASDLGFAGDDLLDAFVGVDVLAVEYNHDERMERASSRPAYLVQRVLGDTGHLSNRQAADFTRAVAARSGPGFPSHLVQLHLSKDCNHPWLAESAGRNALADLSPSAVVITARQDVPARSINLVRRHDAASRTESRSPVPVPIPKMRMGVRPRVCQSLPGFEPS